MERFMATELRLETCVQLSTLTRGVKHYSGFDWIGMIKEGLYEISFSIDGRPNTGKATADDQGKVKGQDLSFLIHLDQLGGVFAEGELRESSLDAPRKFLRSIPFELPCEMSSHSFSIRGPSSTNPLTEIRVEGEWISPLP
jgi:hypothetical protein